MISDLFEYLTVLGFAAKKKATTRPGTPVYEDARYYEADPSLDPTAVLRPVDENKAPRKGYT